MNKSKTATIKRIVPKILLKEINDYIDFLIAKYEKENEPFYSDENMTVLKESKKDFEDK